MKNVFLVFSAYDISLRQILSNNAKGSYSLFIEAECPIGSIEDLLRAKAASGDYKISHTQSGIRYLREGKNDIHSFLSEIANTPTDRAVFVLPEDVCREFVPVLKEKVGKIETNTNHYTCLVAPTKFDLLVKQYAC